METMNVRLPNNWQGWAKIAANIVTFAVAGYFTAGWKGAAATVLSNVSGLFQHTPANTALAPSEVRMRAEAQVGQSNGT